MAPPLMGLPAYRIDNALLNFSGLNEGIDAYQQGRERVRVHENNALIGGKLASKDYDGAAAAAGQAGDVQTALGIAKYQGDREMSDLNLRKAKIEGVGRMAQSALSERDPAKQEAMRQQILSQHPDKDLVSKFPIYGTPQGLRLLAAESGHALNELDEQLKRAQINMMNARAGSYSAKADAYGQPAGPPPDFAMREDGTTYEPTQAQPVTGNALMQTGMRGRASFVEQPNAMVLGDSTTQPGEAKREHSEFGPYDVTTPEVPGIVTRPNASRAMDKAATKQLHGQAAVSDSVDDDRKRMMTWKKTQDRWQYLHGKAAPSGFSYNDDGSLRDLKDESKKAIGREKIGTLIEDVQTANKVLQDTNVVQRGLAHASGGWASPVAEQAARSVEHAVQFMTAEVEGKRHANAQDVRMLKFFAPAWYDSTEMIGFKTDQLNRIMQGYFGAKVPSGDLFKSQLAKANAEYQAAVKSGKLPAPNAMTKPGPLGSASPNQAGGQSQAVKVGSPEEAARLPSGTRFMTHDGREMVKQ